MTRAIEKLHAYFKMSTAWKAEHVTEVTTTMRLWRHENNALLRQKMSQESVRTTTPLLEAIIDAIDEDRAEPLDTSGSRASSVVAAYTDAFERILGAPSGSLITDKHVAAVPVTEAETAQRAAENAAGEDGRHRGHPHQCSDVRGVDGLGGVDQNPQRRVETDGQCEEDADRPPPERRPYGAAGAPRVETTP